jgi:hypothetical protein
MRNLTLVLLTLSFALVAPVASAHPPAGDPHNGCVAYVQKPAAAPAPNTLVVGTVSYFAALRASLPCGEGTPNSRDPFGNPATLEWGSHAASCKGVVNAAVNGAYCGPLVPPGGAVTCSWTPVLNTVPTGLVIGWDVNRDGFQNLVPTNAEPWVYGPYPQFQPAWTVLNPYPAPAQAIAFPTQTAPLFPGAALAPGDLNLVACV